MYTGLHVKYPLFLSDCNETYILLTDFINNTQISKLLKIRPMGAQFFHADGRTDGQTDTTKLRVAFGNFANAPTN